MQLIVPGDVVKLADRVRSRSVTGMRQIIGIAGSPGSGKSTLAELLRQELGEESVVVPMDGFHLANAIISDTPLSARKGAIDTFDVGGYLSILERLRNNDEELVYAPEYRRGLEEPIAASIAVPTSTAYVLTEGNYLLAEQGPWDKVRNYLDEVWFVETERATRMSRLIQRHIDAGMEPAAAEAWAHGPDENNARYIETTKERADLVVRWD